jgi:hypothetical protein
MDAGEDARCYIDDLRARGARAEAAWLALKVATRAPTAPAKTGRGQKARKAQENARDEFDHALEQAYPRDFWTIIGLRLERLAAAEPDAIEIAVRFLEADPWFFHTGYVKADVIKHLLRLDLPADVVPRLQAAALAVVSYRDRGEYRWYCRLARKIATPGFYFRLNLLRYSNRPDVRRRAGWMLDYVENRQVAPRRP